jgi:flavin reductase (DIM6/NTAB) family NADH-FMN oxidoreductase RutF
MIDELRLSNSPAPSAQVDSDTFRRVMRSLAGTVTVISTENDGGLHGFTATAVCSVCAEPPTILIVVNRSARTHAHISRRQAFVVNVVAEDQRSVAEKFSTKENDPFGAIPHSLTVNRVPMIDNSSAYLECQVCDMRDVGTHTIFIGRIVNAGVSGKAPLLYYDGQYSKLPTTV